MTKSKTPLTGFLKETLSKISRYLEMKNTVEIMINKPKEVIVENAKGEFRYFADNALDLKALKAICFGLANATGQLLSAEYPVLSTFIPLYGYRFQAVVGTCVDTGISISIRIGNARTFPLDNYFKDTVADVNHAALDNNLSDDWDRPLAEYIAALIIKGKNFLVSGGTSTGKTTCVNSLIQYIPKELRIITLENMRELSVPHANRVHLTASESKRTNLYKLLSNSILRMRPDRIIIGELTTDLTEFYLRLSSTGHDGSMTTVHADSPVKALDAVMRNLLLAGSSFDVSLMDYIASTIHYVIQLSRSPGRVITARFYKSGLAFDKDKGSATFTCDPVTINKGVQI